MSVRVPVRLQGDASLAVCCTRRDGREKGTVRKIFHGLAHSTRPRKLFCPIVPPPVNMSRVGKLDDRRHYGVFACFWPWWGELGWPSVGPDDRWSSLGLGNSHAG
jgi:hypothetical protein